MAAVSDVAGTFGEGSEWGSLARDRRSAAGVNWRGFEDWLLVDGDLAEATVSSLMGQVRTMTRQGFPWARFAGDPAGAHEAARPYLAWLKRRDHPHSMRLTGRVLNHVRAYLGERDGRWRQDVEKWRLTWVPDGRMDPYTDAESVALRGYRHRNAFVEKRRRAMLYLCRFTSPRRGAVHRMRVDDLRSETGSIVIPRPGKKGRFLNVALPWEAFASTRPLVAYLVARAGVAGDSPWMWLSGDGSRITYGGLGRELEELSAAVGFRVNFNRFRHVHFTVLSEYEVPAQTQLDRHGSKDARILEHYRHATVESQRRILVKHGVPGYRSLRPPSATRKTTTTTPVLGR